MIVHARAVSNNAIHRGDGVWPYYLTVDGGTSWGAARARSRWMLEATARRRSERRMCSFGACAAFPKYVALVGAARPGTPTNQRYVADCMNGAEKKACHRVNKTFCAHGPKSMTSGQTAKVSQEKERAA